MIIQLERLAFINSFYTLISKFSGYVRDIFLAYYIGAGIYADIFFMALRIPVAFKILLSEETFNAAYIPIFNKISTSTHIKNKFFFSHQLIVGTLLILTPMVVLIEIYMPNIVTLFSKNIQDPEMLTLFIRASQIMFPYVVFIGISSVLIGTLNANGRFATSASLPLLINISVVSSCFLFPVISIDKITILSWAVIFGCGIQILALIYSLRGSFFIDLYKNIFILKGDYTAIKNFLVLLWPTFLASSLIFLNLIFGIFIASKDEGGVALLYYSERIYYLPLTLIGISIGIVLLPIISTSKILNDIKAIQLLQHKAYRYCVICIFPIALVLVFFSKDIISLFFYRGVFDLVSVTKSSLALNLYLLGLPSAVIVKMLIPYFYAIRRPKIVLKTIAQSTFCCVISTLILYPIIGFLAVPLALSISSWINVFLLIRVHEKSKSFILDPFLVKYTSKSIIFALFLFCFLSIINVGISNYILHNIYRIILELLLILPLIVFFLYKMENVIYRKIISLLRNLF